MIGSIGSSTVSTSVNTMREKAGHSEEAATTVAEQVAAADEQEPIRSVFATRGTLVDTYL